MEKMYEAVIFIKPTLSEEELNAVLVKVKSFVLENKGVIAEEKVPEKKRMIFEVKKFNDAYYYFMKFTFDTSLVNEYGKRLRMIEEVIRQSVVIFVAPKFKPKKERKKPAVTATAEVKTEAAPVPPVDTKDAGV